MKPFTKLGILTAITVAPAFVIFSFTGSALNSDATELITDKNIIAVQRENKMAIPKLWEDDIILSNEAVLCFTENDSYTDLKINQLCQNKTQLNLTIQSSYGKSTQKKFAELFDKHNAATFDLAIAIQNRDHKSMTESKRVWTENAEEISFLIEKSETNNRLSKMNVTMNDHSKQLNSAIVNYTNTAAEKNLKSKPKTMVTEISEDEINKSLPKKFEGGAIKSMFK